MFRAKRKSGTMVVKDGQNINFGSNAVWIIVFEHKGLPYFDVVGGPRFYDNGKYGSDEFYYYCESHNTVTIELPYV